MTWRTSNGERILQGAEATLIREALAHTVDTVELEIEGDTDPWQFGVVLFDRLEPTSRLAVLAQVAWALLKETEICPPLTAINEAAIAVLFRDVEQSILVEIDSEDEMEDPFFWRSLVLAVFQEGGDTTELPSVRSRDQEEWYLLLECLADQILWDHDFDEADEFLDAPPEKAAYMRRVMTIEDDYFLAVPPDPRDKDLPKLRKMIDEICQC